jgi:hypothetical protein
LRNIIKHDINDELTFSTNKDIQRMNKKIDEKLVMALHKLGPPAFLKKNFKNETIKKYKMVSGLNFGK